MRARFFPSDIDTEATEDGNAVLLTVKNRDGAAVELELPVDVAEKLKSQLDPAIRMARARATRGAH
jgi:hypothetical protein